jgi:CRISPR-associated protein Cmr2
MKYLFLFTISPVQSFISQARKTQDLYAGSRLLSDLVKAAIEEFNKQTNTTDKIIFPANWKQPDAALPNRFLAEVETDENKARNLGENIEKTVKNEFKEIARQIFDEFVKNDADKKKIKEQFFWQIENHLIIHWLFEPLDGQSYKQAYVNIEKNLGAIKNLRKFKQLPDFETGRKDSITGELNALIFNKGGKPNAYTENAIEIVVPAVYLSKGEGLSAVTFVKRFYKLKQNDSFPSTAEIAQYDIKNIVENSKSFQTYKSLFKGNFDYQLLYKDNLNVKYFEKQGLIDFKTNNNSLKIFLNDILDEAKKRDKKQKKYYALLIFDGDNMGKWLSGKFLQNINDINLKEYHKNFSKLLGDFAGKARKYVDNKEVGRTVYAGGDDFLALLNLDKIFDTLSYLRQMFDDEVNKKLKEQYETTNDLTFSSGLVIAHYKEPLGEVLNRARAMEHKAKDAGRNALGIAVMKKSGELLEAVIKWGNEQNITENIENLAYVLDALNDKKISPTFIENLNREFAVFRDEKENNLNTSLIDSEIERLINRAYFDVRKTNETKEEFVIRKKEEKKQIANKTKDLFIEIGNIKIFFNLLNIIDFIYRKA